MQTTGNLSLKKPEGTDLVDIDDLNGNMDILDTVVTGKVDKVTGKQLSTNDYTAVEKTKLTGIATGANNYTHPNHTGDVTSTADGVTAIAAGVIVDADVNAAAGIAWTKLNKTGASLADLNTRSAGDLTSGTLPAARLPAITGDITMAAGTGTAAITAGAVVNADVNAAAAIDATKIGTGIVTNAEFAFLDGVTSAIQTQLDNKTAIADYVRQPAYATTAGTAAAYIVTLSPAPTSLAEGFGITIVMHIANTVSPTLNVNGLGALALKDQKGVAYAAGKLVLGKPYMFRKVGTDFLADSSGGAGDAIAGDIRAGKKAATDAGDIVGTLAVQTGGTVTPGASAIIKAAGIYDTAITVSAVAVPAANVLAGTTIAGTAGTMVRRTGGEFLGYQRADSAMGNSGRVHLYAPPGAYIDLTADNGGGHFGLFADDANFVAANIPTGVSMLGLAGTAKRRANGMAVGSGSISVSGLAFRPSAIIAEYLWVTTPNNFFYRFTYQSTMGLFTRVRFSEAKAYAPDFMGACSYTINNDGFVLNDTGATTSYPLSWLAIE